ncbi:MAG: hypothetical protein HYX32_04505 [Actinobacteria bacterium]|nr:hypothetical protein [Actinomycetota bacterium]
MALIPLGTVNNLARSIGVPTDDVDHSLTVLDAGE